MLENELIEKLTTKREAKINVVSCISLFESMNPSRVEHLQKCDVEMFKNSTMKD
jgi:hypothetical protein